MAAVFGGSDTASASLGFPIRNMHTVSEAGHTGDILAGVHAVVETIKTLQGLHALFFFLLSFPKENPKGRNDKTPNKIEMNGGKGVSTDDLKKNHTRLDLVDNYRVEEK